MRQKLVWFALVALLVAAAGVASAQVAPLPGSTPMAITINGEVQHFMTPPIMVNGQVMVPMGDVFRALNATTAWQSSSRMVAAHNSELVSVEVGHPTAMVGQRQVTLAVAPILYRGQLYVPLQFVQDALGAPVAYDAASGMITIVSAAPVAVSVAPQQFAEAPPVMIAQAQPMVPPATQCSVCAPGPVIVHPQIPVTIQPCPTIYPVPCVTGCATPCSTACLSPCSVACLSTVEWPITE